MKIINKTYEFKCLKRASRQLAYKKKILLNSRKGIHLSVEKRIGMKEKLDLLI